jgi:hypothetical protein
MSGALIMANQQQVRFREAVGNGVNHIALQAPAIVSADQTITLPDQTGTVVTTGDNGSVTSTMILDGTILNVDINASAGIVDTKLATIATAGKVSNSATTATNANTASAIVARDASGNFTAGTITAALTGAASSNVLKAGDTMTGALVVPLASAATPSLTFTSDLNTGIYSPGADQVAVSTGGTGRLFVDNNGNVGISTSSPAFFGAGYKTLEIKGTTNGGLLRLNSDGIIADLYAENSGDPAFIARTSSNHPIIIQTNSTEKVRITSAGNVGIGTSNPGTTLHVQGSATVTSQANVAAKIGANTDSDVLIGSINGNTPFIASQGAYPLALFTNALERARIDSSGRLLVGTSTGAALVHIGNAVDSLFMDRNESVAGGPNASFRKSRGTPGSPTIVLDGDFTGALQFRGYDGASYITNAFVRGEVDGTPGTNDMPGRLVFSTTADGAGSPTERLRITSAGVLQVADAGNITVGTTTGTKIGTATTQKIGFYNATPVVQPTAVADATDAVDVITQLNALLTRMRNLGLIAT